MNQQIPEHLQNCSIDYASDNFPDGVDKSWLDELSTKLKIIEPISGRDQFGITCSGVRYNDGLLGSDNRVPLVVCATMEGADDIVLFDERSHGYESMMVERREFEDPRFWRYKDDSGAELFKLYFCCNSSIDFEDEFSFAENDLIKNLSGRFCNLEWLRANAYDYIVLFLENEHGNLTKLVEIELA